LFRRASGVLIPVTIVLLSLIVTLGLYPLTGQVVTTTVIILPSFLLAMGIAASVHILSIFFQYYDQGMAKNEAVSKALAHSGLPVMMTSFTTAIGLWSFLTAELRSIADLGLFAGSGVLIILVNTLILLPALVSLIRIKRKLIEGQSKLPFLTKFLIKTGDFAVHNGWKVLALTTFLLVLSFAGVAKLVVSHSQLNWFPDNEPVKIATTLIDEKLKGSVSMEVIIKTPKKNGVKNSNFLKKIDSFQEYLKTLEADDGSVPVGTTLSIVDIVKEIHQALNENKEDFYQIPSNSELLAQEILLFENSGSDDLEEVTNGAFTIARITIKVPWKDASFYVNFVKKIQAKAETLFGSQAEVNTTGLLLLFTTAISAIIQSMITSYMLAAVLITLMMLLLLSGVKKGLISMIPNLTPIIITMGIMGWFGVKLDMFTLLIGSIAIGLAVDDTIHFMHKFYAYFGEGVDVKSAVRQTLQTTGLAMMFTSISLVLGFWIFLTASTSNVYFFGLFTGVTILLAFLSDILLSPALMSVIHRNEKRVPLESMNNSKATWFVYQR
ncbi:MAG: MMPL family transporter, partial [Proteobacteria bacterium]|nr:MMPL family transporter [Pseudomonadota bacterium]